MNRWVIQVHTDKEMAVKEALNGFNISVPTKYMYYRRNGIWKLESRLLLPGYIFGEFEKTSENYYIIRRNPHVIRILGELLGEDFAKASWLINGGEAVAPSKVTTQNGDIIALGGFLVGKENTIVAVHRRQKKAVIEMDFLGKKRLMSVPVDFI